MAKVSGAISSVYVSSVINQFIFGQGVVIYFKMQLLLSNLGKQTNGDPDHTAPRGAA